jgi:hypothetical protein
MPGAAKAHIVLAEHDRLIVTHSKGDDTVYVLRPPGEDPKAIPRVARPGASGDAPYGELAGGAGAACQLADRPGRLRPAGGDVQHA